MTEAERQLLDNARAFIRAKEHGDHTGPFYRRMVQAVGAIAKAERIVEEARERATAREPMLFDEKARAA